MRKLIAILIALCLIITPANIFAVSAEPNDSIVTENTTITSSTKTPEEQAIEKIVAHKKANGEKIPSDTRGLTEDIDSGSVYYIKNYFSGKYLNVHYGVDANGTNVYQWTGDSSTEQKFKVVEIYPDCYKIYAMCSSNGNNRVLDVVRNGKHLAAGQNVDIWTPVDDEAQEMILTPLIYDNIFHIQMKYNDDFYLTSYGNSNGTSGGKTATSAGNVFIKSFNINDNQQWQFIKIPSPSTPSYSDYITGKQPYRTSNYTLSQGGCVYIKFKPTENFNCSIFTISQIDTYIQIYSDEACTDLIVLNDNSGHDHNALINFDVTANTTYYIRVKGFNNTVSGNFKFVLHRGLPTSQSEKGNMYDVFNSETYQLLNNCYTYALGYPVLPTNGDAWSEISFGAGANPGMISGYSLPSDFLDSSSKAKIYITEALESDLNYLKNASPSIDCDYNIISETTQPQEGYYKIALVIDSEESALKSKDYHWYRQLPNGQWVHKRGSGQASNLDASGNVIYNPSTCDRDYTSPTSNRNYSEFVTYYEVKTPETQYTQNVFNNLSLRNVINQNSLVSTNTNLTMADIDSLYIGMPYEKAIKILGAPHDYTGFGMVRSLYEIRGGIVLSVDYDYKSGCIECIRILDENGELTLIQ